MSEYSKLRFYRKHLRQRYKQLFPCSFCGEMILAENYENHITKRKHGLDVKRVCPWCQKVSWVYGQKHQNMNHLYNCVEQFFNPRNTEEDEFSPYRPVYDLTPEFKTKDFFGEKKLDRFRYGDPKDELYHDFAYNVPDEYLIKFDSRTETILKEWNGIVFQSDILNRAAEMMKYYLLTTRSDSGLEKRHWFHIMIRTVAIGVFYSVLHQFDDNRTKILPYNCHCTGGKKMKNYEYEQHIHMLVATKTDKHFVETLWNEIEFHSRTVRHYGCKFKKPIVSPLHFLNAMGYVSGRKSRCLFGRLKSKKARLNHFNLSCSFPKNFKYALATLWETGLQELVANKYQNHIPSFNIHHRTDKRGVVRVDGKWKSKYRYLPGLMEKIMEIPVDLRYKPVEYQTNTYLHLGKNNILYLEQDDSYHFSADVLRDRTKTEYFTFRPKIQNTFNITDRNMDQVLEMKNAEMETMKNALQMEMREMNKNHQNMIENLQTEIRELKNMLRVNSLEAEIRELKNALQAKEIELEKIRKNVV